MVEIYLSNNVAQNFLSVPLSDVKRLAIRPFKWLRFVMFCICGARGDLSATPDGPPVKYDTDITSFADATYYYKAREEFIFVDPNCLSERMTSTGHTARSHDFRTDVMRRDGVRCVITGMDCDVCDATHLIPLTKGDEYIQKVVRDRTPRYETALHSPIASINDVKNGLLLTKLLHAEFSNGSVAFLKTPGFGLDASDILRIDQGSAGSRTDWITLQHLREPYGFDAANLQTLMAMPQSFAPSVYLSSGANMDALFRGTGNSLPSTIILDFMYGVATFNLWGDNQLEGVVEQYFDLQYKPLLRQPPNDPRYDDDGGDASDSNYDARASEFTPTRDIRMAKAIDKMCFVLMHLKGISPKDAANLRKKRMEEEMEMAQEASRTKVMEWRQSSS